MTDELTRAAWWFAVWHAARARKRVAAHRAAAAERLRAARWADAAKRWYW